MSLVHDLAESIVGDITPYDGVSKEEKQKREEAAMKVIGETLDKEMGELVLGLWREYEEGTSAEAQVVKDLDKYEMLIQAWEYENKYGEDLSEFFESTALIRHPKIKEWAIDLMASRRKIPKTGEENLQEKAKD